MNADFDAVLTVADDFYVNMDLETVLALPTNRETVLHFCEAIGKQFPSMTGFYQREGGEFVLESDRESGQYFWMEIHPKRLSAGAFNPQSLDVAYQLHRWLLDRSRYFLGIGGLDAEALNVSFGFNMDFKGNRDDIVADALYAGSPLSALAGEGIGKCVECQPAMVITLDEECYLQARLSVETHCNSFQVRTGEYDAEPITVYFTVRGHPRPGEVMNLAEAFDSQIDHCEQIVGRTILPQIIRPIADAIATAQ